MAELRKYKEKIKKDRSFYEHIAMALPGYRGYRQKELRRDTDQLVRNKSYTTMSQGLKELKWCYRELINADKGLEGANINRLLSKVDKANEKIRHSKRGYSGVWQSIKTYTKELDELLDFDFSLINTCEKFLQNIENLKKEIKIKNYDTLGEITDKLEGSIDDFDGLFNRRDEVIIGLSKGDDKI